MITRIIIGCTTSLDNPVRRSESAFPATGQDILRIANDDFDDDDDNNDVDDGGGASGEADDDFDGD